MRSFDEGYLLGTGAAINVELGYIPSRVEVVNITDGDVVNFGFPGTKFVAFTSGGTTEVSVGDRLKGDTSGATGDVVAVLLASGSWAGGDAAGTLVIAADGAGTFVSETLSIDGGDSNVATIGANFASSGVDIDTEVATDTGITAYVGSQASAAKGFTIATAISESGKVLYWSAQR